MAYIAGTIKEQWFCLDPDAREAAWTFAAGASAGVDGMELAQFQSIFITWNLMTGWYWKSMLFLSQWNVPLHFDCSDTDLAPPCIKYADIEWIAELIDGVVSGDLPVIISHDQECRARRGFP